MHKWNSDFFNPHINFSKLPITRTKSHFPFLLKQYIFCDKHKNNQHRLTQAGDNKKEKNLSA